MALTLLQNGSAVYESHVTIQHDPHYLAVAYPAVFREAIGQSSPTYKVPAALLYGLVREKSLLYRAARSSTGALGVLQFLPDTLHTFNRRWRVMDASPAATHAEFLLNPALSLDLGAQWFDKELLPRRQGNILLALMEYHAGESAVDTWHAEWQRLQRSHDVEYMIETIPAQSTRQFVRRVLTDMMITHAAALFPPHGRVSKATDAPSGRAGKPRYRLALLPAYTSNFQRIYHADDRAVDLVQAAVQESDVFDLSFSFHNETHVKNAAKHHKITNRMLNKVWRGGKPKFDLVYQIGDQLGVDFVAMYEFAINYHNDDEMKIYLINIKGRTENSQSVFTEGCFSEGDGYIEELEITRKMFSDSVRAMR